MKLKLYGLEVYEVARKYPEFVLDSVQYPELELEMEAVVTAEQTGNDHQTRQALEELYIKMYDTPAKGSYEDTTYTTDILSVVAPFEGSHGVTENYGDESAMFKLVAIDSGKI